MCGQELIFYLGIKDIFSADYLVNSVGLKVDKKLGHRNKLHWFLLDPIVMSLGIWKALYKGF